MIKDILSRVVYPNPAEAQSALVDVMTVPYWINSVNQFKDVGVVARTDLANAGGAAIALRTAMEVNGIEQIDFSLIGKVQKAVNDWLVDNKPLAPLSDATIGEYRDQFEAWSRIEQNVRSQPGVDDAGYGMPLIVATVSNSIALNQFLAKIKQSGLDINADFKSNLRSLVETRQSAIEHEAKGADQATEAPLQEQMVKAARAVVQTLAPNRVFGRKRFAALFVPAGQ